MSAKRSARFFQLVDYLRRTLPKKCKLDKLVAVTDSATRIHVKFPGGAAHVTIPMSIEDARVAMIHATMNMRKVGEKRRHRQMLKSPIHDAYGRLVDRGNSLILVPVSERWSLWKRCGWLQSIIPATPGWKSWRGRAECDNVTPSPLPG